MLALETDTTETAITTTTVLLLLSPSGFTQGALVVKNSSANAGDIREPGLIPGSGRFPGGGYGNSLQYSCLETSTDRGAWWVTVHRITKSRTRRRQLSMHWLTGEDRGPERSNHSEVGRPSASRAQTLPSPPTLASQQAEAWGAELGSGECTALRTPEG